MGRKSEKSLMKQQRMKEEKKQLASSQAAVKKANSLEDPLKDFPVFHKYNKNGIDVKLSCSRMKDLLPEVLEWIIDLMTRNMKDVYNQCEWGWDGDKKRDEMTEEAAWYLVAFASDTNRPIGFSHFRFDMDYGYEVLYVYELQLEPENQRKGLGKFMAQVLELIAFKNNMRKVVLTVLKHNKSAIDFYSTLKYSIDETCPEDNFEEQFCYLILSKVNKNFKSPVLV